MSYAHSKDVIHRDLKPANIMVGRFGEVYVMDWGLAKVMGREDRHDLRLKSSDGSEPGAPEAKERDGIDAPLITMDGTVVGTPAYMPPEQAEGRLGSVGPHSDVYSMGAMLYELLTGRAPYARPDERKSPHGTLLRLLKGPPPSVHELNADVPAELEAICDKAMARDGADRYADTSEMAEDLQAYLEGVV